MFIDLDTLLTAEQVAYLAHFPAESLQALAVENGPCFVKDLVPVAPGLWNVSQAFGVRCLVHLRKRKGWVANVALNVAAALARHDPGNLEAFIMQTSERFVVGLQPLNSDAGPDERQVAYTLLDADEVQEVLRKLVPKCCTWPDMHVSFADLEPEWLTFVERLAQMNETDFTDPSNN